MARVLVTGSAGAIGLPACAALREGGHAVRAFDRRPTPDVADAIVGDIADYAAVFRAVQGVDAVVHLAAIPVDAPFDELVGPNVYGVHHVLEAARAHGVRRVVLASTVQTVGTLPRERKVSVGDRAPSNHYALTKIWAEELGALASRVHGLEVVLPRIAWMVRNPDEARRLDEYRFYDLYLSPRDAGRFFRASVEVAVAGSAVMYVAGPECERRFDLEPTRRFGFEPRDRFPDGLPFEAVRTA